MAVLGSLEQRDQVWARAQRRHADAGEPDPERVLVAYLRFGYHGAAPLQINGRANSATGRVLRDCVVSKLEVEAALSLLPEPERRCVEVWWIGNRSRRLAARELGLDDRAMHVLAHNGLRAMVARVMEWSTTGTIGLVA